MRAQNEIRPSFCMELHSASILCFPKLVKHQILFNFYANWHFRKVHVANKKRLRQAWNKVSEAWGYQSMYKCKRTHTLFIAMPYWYQIGPYILLLSLCGSHASWNRTKVDVTTEDRCSIKARHRSGPQITAKFHWRKVERVWTQIALVQICGFLEDTKLDLTGIY